MQSDWKRSTVGAVSLLVTKGTTPTTVGFSFQDTGVNFVKIESISIDGRFIRDKFVRISSEAHTALSRSQLAENDILFTIAGTIGRTAIVTRDILPANTNQAIAIIRPLPSLVLPHFLRYVLSNPAFLKNALSRTVESVQANFSLGELKNADIWLPPLQQQKGMVDMLGSIDDRIDLLRQTNGTLEAVAQALFKSWFIDFDPVRAKAEGREPGGMDAATAALFPAAFKDSPLGPIPVGWASVSIGDLCERVVNGATPSRSKSDFWNDGDIPWFKTGELADGYLLQSSEQITHQALANSSAKVLPRHSILMAIYAAPTVGRLGILTADAAFNQACTGMKAINKVGPWFLYQTLFHGREWFNSRANGAAQQNISKAIVESYCCVQPCASILSAFNGVASPLYACMERNAIQIKVLTELRDTLLPRLISGRLRVPEAREQIEDALA